METSMKTILAASLLVIASASVHADAAMKLTSARSMVSTLPASVNA